MLPIAKLKTVVVQPSPFCNIDCKYCYLPNRNSRHRMQFSTLRRVFEFLFECPDLVTPTIPIIWHAGEPLALPISFYDSAFSLGRQLSPSHISLCHRIQTNGTLITQDWCDFFKTTQCEISISLDGPREFHNSRRVDRAGHGSFDRVMRGIDLIRSNNIPFSIVGVLSAESIRCPEQLFDFYHSLCPELIGFNFEEIVGVNKQSSFIGISQLQVEWFLKSFLALRNQYAPKMRLRDIDILLQELPRWRGHLSQMDSVPMQILTIAWNGDVSTYSPELLGLEDPRFRDFVFGNVDTHRLADLLADNHLASLGEQIDSGIARCRQSCSYFCVCGGGSPVNKLSEHGTFDSTETMYCRFRIKAVANVVMGYLEEQHNVRWKAEPFLINRLKWLLPLMTSQAVRSVR